MKQLIVLYVASQRNLPFLHLNHICLQVSSFQFADTKPPTLRYKFTCTFNFIH